MDTSKKVLKRGKAWRALNRVAQLLNCSESELVAAKETLGYSNTVFKVSKGKQNYLYKEYLPTDGSAAAELEWQKLFQTPRVLFETPLYRIDEYIEHKPGIRRLIRTRSVLESLATAVAQMHATVPPPQLATDYLALMAHKRQLLEKRINHRRFAEICQKLEARFARLYQHSLLAKCYTLCHNDLQPGNILVRPDGQVQLIDFEHVSMNLPTVELANFFNELSSDYSKKDAPFRAFPLSPETTLGFIEQYLAQTTFTCTPAEFLSEVEAMRGVSCYYWALWGISLVLEKKSSNKSLDYFRFVLNKLDYLRASRLLTPTNVKEVKQILTHTI